MKFAHGAILLALLAQTAGAGEPQIPGRFMFKLRNQVIWISQRELFTEGGSVRPGILDEDRWRLFERLRKMKKDGDCDVQFIGSIDSYEDSVKTWEDLIRVAAGRTLISGTVTASDVGLHMGTPHTVLRIDREAGGAVHVIYPHGRIEIEDMLVCNADPYYSPPPAVGDRIAMIVAKPIDETGTLYWPAGSSIFYERDGALVAAPYFRDDPGVARFKTLQSVTDLLRSMEKSQGR